MGVIVLVTAICGRGRVNDFSCSRASCSLEPVGLVGDDFAVEQPHDDAERFRHAVALLVRIDAEHHGVGHEQAGAEAEHGASAGLVVELHHAVGDHQRMMIGQRDHAGAEPDMLGALGGGGDEQLGRAVGFVAAGMVFADPGFVKAELVEPLDQLEIALEAQQRVFVVGMKRRQENSRAQLVLGHHVVVSPPVQRFDLNVMEKILCRRAAR